MNIKKRLSGQVIHGQKPGRKPYLTKQKEKEFTDHSVLAAKVGYVARWLSEITITEQTKSPNFAWDFFSTYSTVLA